MIWFAMTSRKLSLGKQSSVVDGNPGLDRVKLICPRLNSRRPKDTRVEEERLANYPPSAVWVGALVAQDFRSATKLNRR